MAVLDRYPTLSIPRAEWTWRLGLVAFRLWLQPEIFKAAMCDDWVVAIVVKPRMSLSFSFSSAFREIMLSLSFDTVRLQASHSDSAIVKVSLSIVKVSFSEN